MYLFNKSKVYGKLQFSVLQIFAPMWQPQLWLARKPAHTWCRMLHGHLFMSLYICGLSGWPWGQDGNVVVCHWVLWYAGVKGNSMWQRIITSHDASHDGLLMQTLPNNLCHMVFQYAQTYMPFNYLGNWLF